mmetsp:Transcript_23987/g.74983  ORF Transcript_23987/g.74983 Transcript_23987/m.74983 type:complete len:89 (-) Transcript_23987:1043-1309(-)
MHYDSKVTAHRIHRRACGPSWASRQAYLAAPKFSPPPFPTLPPPPLPASASSSAVLRHSGNSYDIGSGTNRSRSPNTYHLSLGHSALC